MIRFALASLALVALLAAACLAGGVWPVAALVYVTLFVALIDRLAARPAAAREGAGAERFARALTAALALAHVLLLALGVWAVARAPWLGPGQAGCLAVALGLFMGQVSHPVAHELIHARARRRRRLGAAIYVSLLFGHHVSAHLRVHHVHVASARDPNSAALGVGFYRFWPRAWAGSFMAGLRAETAARRRAGGRRRGLHPYLGYCAGAALVLAVAGVLAGLRGVAVYLGLCAYAQMQILLADYVQHYGLRRHMGGDGRPEPVGARHGWNAPHRCSSALMLNAPRHSDHHCNPARAFPALRLDPARMPMLPHALPVMAAAALVPPLWRRMMDGRARRWSGADGGARGLPHPAAFARPAEGGRP